MSTKKFNAKTIEAALYCSWLQLKYFNFGGKDKYWAFIYDRVFPDYYNIERIYIDKLSDKDFSWWISRGEVFIRECEMDINNLNQEDSVDDSLSFDETPICY